MKGRMVVLDQLGGQQAACLIVDGVLTELSVDPAGDTPLPGAIYRAVADRPLKGQGGMFVKMPGGQSGFLRQTGGIAPGQRLLVQITGQGAARYAAAPVQIALRDPDARRAGAERLARHPRGRDPRSLG